MAIWKLERKSMFPGSAFSLDFAIGGQGQRCTFLTGCLLQRFDQGVKGPHLRLRLGGVVLTCCHQLHVGLVAIRQSPRHTGDSVCPAVAYRPSAEATNYSCLKHDVVVVFGEQPHLMTLHILVHRDMLVTKALVFDEARGEGF